MAEVPSSNTVAYQSPPPGKPIRKMAIVLAIVAPTLLQAGFVTLMEWPRRNIQEWSGLLSIAAAIAVGITFLALSGLRPRIWLPSLLFYLPFQIGWLVLFTITFACSIFGDCP